MSCVIHHVSDNELELIPLTDTLIKKIENAKVLHEGTDDIIFRGMLSFLPLELLPKKHCVHKECYDKFTRILRGKKTPDEKVQEKTSSSRLSRSRTSISSAVPPSSKTITARSPQEIPVRSSKRVTSPPSSEARNKFVYPKECTICNKYQIQVCGVEEKPNLLTEKRAATAILENAKQKPEYAELYSKIVAQDLLAAEFKCHTKCRRELTRPITPPCSSKQDAMVTNIKRITDYIEEHVLLQQQSLSMVTAQRIYSNECEFDSNTNNARKERERLKKSLMKVFGEKLLFLAPRPRSPEIIISASTTALQGIRSRDTDIIEVARYLRRDIEKYCLELPEISWPPTIEELTADNRLPPASVTLFLTNLLKNPSHKEVPQNVSRLVESFSSDFIHGVSKGSVMTAKHFLLGLGLHSLSGQKKVVQLTNRLGNCMSYDRVLDIETAQAQKAQQLANEGSYLPLRPAQPENSVTTFFWVDNFDKNIEAESGGSAVNITTMMAFQEMDENAIHSPREISVEKNKSRIIQDTQTFPTVVIKNNGKPEPTNKPFSNFATENHSNLNVNSFAAKYFLWLFLRYLNSSSQIHPTLSGWLLRIRMSKLPKGSGSICKTIETYLPPLTTKVTDPITIYRYMQYLQQLAAEMNMEYVNITLDIGAAINAYKVLWSYPNIFKNIVIQLGDFHFLKENFKVMGNFVKDSGFEDIIFQASVCTSGSLNGAMSGSHYNRGWIINIVMSEALERLLFKRFLQETKPEIDDEIGKSLLDNSDLNHESNINLTHPLQNKYNEFKSRVREGYAGKTAQFWITYLDLMQTQHMAHTSVQENDFHLRLKSWRSFLPWYFALDMHNYARYGSYYVEILNHIDGIYPGLQKVLSSKGLSVQAQSNYPLRTAIDQRGEQTINCSAKTSGGITQFASKSSSVLKWCLNRSEAATNVNALYEMAGLSEAALVYKPLRPVQITKSEQRVQSVLEVLENEYINPFSTNIEKSKLIHLSSGVQVEDKAADDILNAFKTGQKLYGTFRDTRLLTQEVKFHATIKRNSIATFAKALHRKVTLKHKDGRTKTAEVNRNILGALVSYQLKTGRNIDFEKALNYPLSPVPLSICHPDGTPRKTGKSKLKDIIFKGIPIKNEEPGNCCNGVAVVDMMALLNTFTSIPKTYAGLADKFVRALPQNYLRVDIVADTYKKTSIKGLERALRGESEKIHIASLESKTPSDFSRIMKNGENKTRLIELIIQYIKTFKIKVLNHVRCTKLVVSSSNSCISITSSEITEEEGLQSSQEEADTKLILHCHKIASILPSSTIVLRSHSGDTDVIVLAVALLQECKERLILDNGNGKNRHQVKLSDIDLDEEIIDSLIGFHSFTGNDYCSSFFRKGKETCFKTMLTRAKFQAAFARLGVAWELTDDLIADLEQFVCKLYKSKLKEINKARYKQFKVKFSDEDKATDMAALIPCRSVFILHAKRANYIACIWKRACIPDINEPHFTSFGWNTNGNVIWVERAYPDEIKEILFSEEYDDKAVYGAEGDSDEES